MLLLDANVVSEIAKPRPSPEVVAWLDAQNPRDLFISAVVKTEVEYGVFLEPEGKRKSALEAATNTIFSLLFKGRCLPFDEASSAHCAMIRSARKRAGRPIEMADAMIAATARRNGFSIAARDAAFAGIDGLAVVDPWR